MATTVNIITAGARTSLGLQAPPSAAALRAGISGMGEHPFMIDQVGDPMPGALDSLLDPGMTGPERFLALAETALLEACAPLMNVPGTPLRLPIYLGLPELRPGFTEQDAWIIQSRLARVERLPIQVSVVEGFMAGHAAGLLALATATRQIQQGAIDACLVGGIESYFHADTMEWLDEHRQLVGAVSRSGFVPGEGAAFCLLMSDRAAKRFRLPPQARLHSVAIGRETKLIKTADVCLGTGLTEVVRQAVSGLQSSEKINDILCDINGERYRGEEWGFVCLRLSRYFDNPSAYLSPADAWGDMGAASGPLFTMLACQAAARGYAKGPRSLLWASSEGGLRAAAVLLLNSAGGGMKGESHYA